MFKYYKKELANQKRTSLSHVSLYWCIWLSTHPSQKEHTTVEIEINTNLYWAKYGHAGQKPTMALYGYYVL